jgi:hypothetical protein
MAAKRKKETSSPVTGGAPEQRDYVQVAIDYAKDAVADKKGKRFGRWVRLAAERFLADLKRARYDHAKGTSKATRKNAPFMFDAWHAWDPCDFIEKLPHVEGEWDTPTVVMHESHIFFVVNLFGFRNHDGTRRFSTALFAVARKNAKSFLCSAVLLYCFCCEGGNGPQVISAATTGSQARIVFNVAKRIVELVSDLREAFTLEPFVKRHRALRGRRHVQADQRQGQHAGRPEPVALRDRRDPRPQESRPAERSKVGGRRAQERPVRLHHDRGLYQPRPVGRDPTLRQAGAAGRGRG